MKVYGMTREERQMLAEERRDLLTALRRPRPFWLGVVEWAADRAAMRARLAEIEEEMAA